MILTYEGILQFGMFTSKTTHKSTVVQEVTKIINKKLAVKNRRKYR